MPNLIKSEVVTIVAIAQRAIKDVFEPQGVKIQMIDLMMDLEHTHAIIPLKLDELLAADAGNFGHDISGIYRHFNRQTLQMDDQFTPRYAQPTPLPDKFILQVAEQSVEYSIKYTCPLSQALDDWEGNGPDGQFGLQDDERTAAECYLRSIGHDLNAQAVA